MIGLFLTAFMTLILAPGLGVAVARVAAGHHASIAPPGRFVVSADNLASLASILLVALALAMLPWPLHPAGDRSWIGRTVLLWAVIEGAFLIPLAVGLLSPVPRASRAVVREAQINAAGRLVLWFAAGSSLWSGADWSPATIPGRILLAIGGVMAVAAATGLGPFAPDRALASAGPDEGLDENSRWWATLARHSRAGLMLALLVVSILPSANVVQPVLALLLAVAFFTAALLALRQARLILPQYTLSMTLQWCFWRALPIALAGNLYLTLR